jgi:hypothetical protein
LSTQGGAAVFLGGWGTSKLKLAERVRMIIIINQGTKENPLFPMGFQSGWAIHLQRESVLTIARDLSQEQNPPQV